MSDSGGEAALRRLSPQAASTVERLSQLADELNRAPGKGSDVIGRPHPLLVCVRRDAFQVLVAPASVWDKGRELLAPYTERLAESQARLILLGSPRDPDLARALNAGLCALLPEAPERGQLLVALHSAFELLEVKARSESRGKWLNRYRYELAS